MHRLGPRVCHHVICQHRINVDLCEAADLVE
jgi:hypothetical protein